MLFAQTLCLQGILAVSPGKSPSAAQHKDALAGSVGGGDEGGLVHRLSQGPGAGEALGADGSHELEEEVQRAMIAGARRAGSCLGREGGRRARAVVVGAVLCG